MKSFVKYRNLLLYLLNEQLNFPFAPSVFRSYTFHAYSNNHSFIVILIFRNRMSNGIMNFNGLIEKFRIIIHYTPCVQHFNNA